MQDIEKIYEEYFETVNKYLFCLTHNNDISEELTQETFYKAVKKIDTYKGECKMSIWLCQIAKNLWYDQCRKNKKFVDTKEVDLLNVQALNTLEEQVISNDEKISLYKKIQKLDDKTIINKFFENSLNVSETSRQLYIHRNTLVYRLDKLQKTTNLDLSVFDDAIRFKIALMVVKYMKYMESIDY